MNQTARLDLTQYPVINRLLRSRWPQFLIAAVALGGFAFAIAAGLAGTPVGSRNFAIVMVWIAWWAALILVLVPLLGRGWCSVCPIPLPGEWLQRGALLGPATGSSRRGLGLNLRWPNRLRNIWLQNAGFALLAVFSPVVLTQPRVTAWVLLALFVVAVALSLVYERRAFCRYVCPVGGFVGLYAQFAPIEVRVKDTSVCAAHTEKSCYTGSADGYGCPWQVFPGGLVKNTYCGACMECLRACPLDNIAINLRPPGADLTHLPGPAFDGPPLPPLPAGTAGRGGRGQGWGVRAGRRLDEAFKNFRMLGSAIVYAAVLLGPWGALKSAAYLVGTAGWFIYAPIFLVFVFAALPGLFYLAVRAGRGQALTAASKAFVALSYSLVPLGLAAWVAFSLAFVFTNLSYVWPVLSDPMGWGWNLLGTATLAWTPYLSALLPPMQVAVLLGGLLWMSATAQRIAQEPGLGWRPGPVIGFGVLSGLALMGLLIA
jgi:ferredoxin